MTTKVVLYHKVDGAVEMFSCHVEEALAHPSEWSKQPWEKKQADEQPADIMAGVARSKKRGDEPAK